MVFGSAALAAGAMNSPEDGYNFCVNNTTKVVSFPAATKCPKGSTLINFGAQGVAGTNGANGATGPQGVKGDTGATGSQGVKGDTGAIGLPGLNGLNGSSLLGGVGFPNNSLGNNGDMYIDKNGALIYGPKSSGLWGNPTAFGGPAGATGPKGDTGATGPKGDTGATGPAGAATSATIQYVSSRVDSDVALDAYNGILPPTTVVSVTAPGNGTYLASFYAEIYQGSSPANGLCRIFKNGVGVSGQFSSNSSIKNYANTLTLLSGDVVSLRCNGNTSGYSAQNSFAYLLKVSN